MRSAALFAVGLLLTACQTAWSCGGYFDFSRMAILAASDDPGAPRAIERLRDMGPIGLQAMFEEHADLIRTARENPAAVAPSAEWQRLRTALDVVGGQRDEYTSELYWYTDLAQAQAVAQQQHKPILSLHLLGKLTDEYSCANSRFFRTALYANQEVSRVLRERFVLHWQSERPVPMVTIDFGDGRTLQRTLTGNSVHYVLDAEGRPIDALPGLYGPQAFLQGLEPALELAEQLRSSSAEREVVLKEYHRTRLGVLLASLDRDQRTVQVSAAPAMPVPRQAKPKAAKASVRAVTKHVVEAPLLAVAQAPAADAESLPQPDPFWQQVASLHAADARLDVGSRTLLARHLPVADPQLAAPKAASESPLQRLVFRFEKLLALDSVRNEYLLHRQIHQWFTAGTVDSIDNLNQRVYAELFLTPANDPWLGLAPLDDYTALEENGLRCARTK